MGEGTAHPGEVSDQVLKNGVSRETECYKNLEQDIEEDRESGTEEMQMAMSRWNGHTFEESEIIEVVAAVGTLKKRASMYNNLANNSMKIAHIVLQVNRVYLDDPQFLFLRAS